MPNFDYIVVGAGSAGCVVANRLSENPDATVLLLEAGASDGSPESAPAIHDPGQNQRLWFTDFAWQYWTEPERELLMGQVQPRRGRRAFWPRGKVLGGSSSISSMVYIRGNRADFNEWESAGNYGWGYRDVLPLFKKSEHQQRGPDQYHGCGGPMAVSDVSRPHPASPAFVEAAIDVGFRRNADFNAEHQAGAGLLQVNVRDGRRESASTAFLNPIRVARENLTIETHAQATRILFEGDRAIGVEYLARLGPLSILRQAHAEREIVVCAGVVDSTKLLLLSGVGPATELARHGIDVVADLAGVGENLQDHPVVALGRLYRDGAMSPAPAAGAVEACLFAASRHGSRSRPDLQLHFTHFLLTDPAYVYPPMPFEAGMAIVPTLVRPRSRGRISIASSDAGVQPSIQPNYLTDPADLEALADGFEIARAIAEAAPMRPFAGPEVAPGSSVQSRRDVRTYIRMVSSGLFHGAGTCRMGVDDMAVVDPELRVSGVRGLRVADASIMPVVTAGNTHAPTVMIGEKAAELLRASW